jgi:hypothetical protein
VNPSEEDLDIKEVKKNKISTIYIKFYQENGELRRKLT